MCQQETAVKITDGRRNHQVLNRKTRSLTERVKARVNPSGSVSNSSVPAGTSDGLATREPTMTKTVRLILMDV